MSETVKGFLAGIVARGTIYPVVLWFSLDFLVVTDIKS